MAVSLPISLATGRPIFTDPRLATLAARQGVEAAWRAALTDCPDDSVRNLPNRVEGGFAVALREPSGRVFMAVDRFAICSLVYRVTNGKIEFASRADAWGDEPGIDNQAVFDYLYFHAIPSPRTVFRGVHRLPPGYCAVFEHGQLAVSRYWTAEFIETRQPAFDALRDEFRLLLKQAVASQLDGSKAACFLSGGTDSSTVAGMIREATGQAAATYSIGFEAEGYDEMAYARIAAQRFGTEHHEYYVTPADLVRSIPEVAAHYDQPFGNSSALPSYYCARMARDDGVTHILAGDGGDELFGGNSRYAKQRVFDWYGSIPAGLRRGLLEPIFETPAVARLPLLKKGSSYIEQAKVPMPERQQMYNLLLRLGIDDVLTPAFLAQVDIANPGRRQREVWNTARADRELNRNLAYDWRYTLAETDLPKVCGTTQLAGVSVGFPMLDARLLEFSLRLPSEMKLKGQQLRWFFKEALRGWLPDEIIVKKKQGFGLPFGVWLMRTPALKTMAVDALASLESRGIVKPAFIRTLVDRRLPEHPGYYGEMVWILMMMEFWMQAHAPGHRL